MWSSLAAPSLTERKKDLHAAAAHVELRDHRRKTHEAIPTSENNKLHHLVTPQFLRSYRRLVGALQRPPRSRFECTGLLWAPSSFLIRLRFPVRRAEDSPRVPKTVVVNASGVKCFDWIIIRSMATPTGEFRLRVNNRDVKPRSNAWEARLEIRLDSRMRKKK